MTDAPTLEAPRPRRPGWTAVVTSAVALFLVLVLVLGVQMRAGRDPALGPEAAATARPAAPPPVVVVRWIVTRRVIRVVDDAPATPAARVAMRTSAPAPAPAPVPAPAPAPAPLQTSAS